MMAWKCMACGAQGEADYLMSCLEQHANGSPDCPAAEKPIVVIDGSFALIEPRPNSENEGGWKNGYQDYIR